MKKVILIILLTMLPLLLSSYLVITNENFFKGEFSKHNVYEKYPEVDLDEYNEDVLGYLRGRQENMPAEIFLNERELKHMEDVRAVFGIFILLLQIVIIGIILLVSFTKDISRILKLGGLFSIGFSLLLLVFFYFGFNFSFEVFHNLFFEEGSYLFLPTDSIINIYPQGLFFDIFTRVFFISMLISIILITISKIYKRSCERKTDKKK